MFDLLKDHFEYPNIIYKEIYDSSLRGHII